MGARERRKGAEAERELVRELRELIGEDVERNLDQPRGGGGDVLLPGWSVEAKRVRSRPQLIAWWAQAVAQAGDRWPALAYRLDRRPWRVRVPLAVLAESAGPVEEVEWTVELSLTAFAAIVREEVA
ncbi:MAG: hypothetical protein ACLFSI_02505 [Halorhodospira sp.]